MAQWTLKEIAFMYGAHYTTVHRHIKQLKKEGKFVKTSVGRCYNDVDTQELSKLLGFKFSAH